MAVMLAAAVLAGAAGCGGKNETAKNGGELSLYMWMNGAAFKEDYPVFLEAEKKTGVHIKGYLSKSTTDSNAAFNIMMASGELPDLIQTGGRARFDKYGREGAYMPLNDLIDKYAPNVKKVLDEHPDYKEFITATDGNIYYLPYIQAGDASEGWFVRQDWLDKLGLKAPETIQELHDVMKAFKEKDPNGNGQQDEVPYFSRNKNSGIDDLYALWNVNTSFTVENGKVKYAPAEKQFKEATATIASWYKEGLIDQEIYTRGEKSREFMLGNNIGGMTHDWFGSTADYNTKLKDSVPGINFIPIAPPAGYDGVQREMKRRESVTDSGVAISSNTKNPELAIKWLDFWYSEEGHRLMNFGIEGEDYTMSDGKPMLTDNVLKGDKAPAQYLMSRGAQSRVSFIQDFEYEKQWLNHDALNGMEMYINNNWFTEFYTPPLMEENDQETYNSIITDVQTLASEQIQKWILGGENVEDNYDEFIAKIKSMQIDKAVELLNKYYK